MYRTYPYSEHFGKKQEVVDTLFRVLGAFSVYDRSVGYVQGMNFIAASLLYHCSEELAFWLFVSLIEEHEMRDIYQNNLPGLSKHCQIIEILQSNHLPQLFYHFSKYRVTIEMYASDWIFTLFTNIIPLEH